MAKCTHAIVAAILLACAASSRAEDAKPAKDYFGHPVVEDRYGVIAPWYRGQNGQCDFRARISEETLKRYPWTEAGTTAMQGPHHIFNGIRPEHGMLALRFWNRFGGEAMVQAVEIGPGDSELGAQPVKAVVP